jgi:hypothetical protein
MVQYVKSESPVSLKYVCGTWADSNIGRKAGSTYDGLRGTCSTVLTPTSENLHTHVVQIYVRLE